MTRPSYVSLASPWGPNRAYTGTKMSIIDSTCAFVNILRFASSTYLEVRTTGKA